jgi:hypothetical protein
MRRAHSQAENQRKKQQCGGAAEHGVASREERPQTDQGTKTDQQRHGRAKE